MYPSLCFYMYSFPYNQTNYAYNKQGGKQMSFNRNDNQQFNCNNQNNRNNQQHQNNQNNRNNQNNQQNQQNRNR